MEIEVVEVTVVRETEKAYCLADTASRRENWFPKSQVSFKSRNIHTGAACAEIPVWLLKSKGWYD